MFATLLARPRRLTAAVALATLTLLASHPTLAKSIGADVWNVPALNDELRQSNDASDRLDGEDDEIRQRIAVKEAIVGELIAGRTTLPEVTAKFTELNATRPEYVATIRATYPGATDQEKAARNVIAYTLSRVPDADRDASAQRLDAELEQMISASGAH